MEHTQDDEGLLAHRILLSAQADVTKLEQLLHDAVRSTWEEEAGGLPAMERKAAKRALVATCNHFLAVLKHCVVVEDGAQREAAAAPEAEEPAEDPELAALEAEVWAASQRVAELRRTVPGLLQERLDRSLEEQHRQRYPAEAVPKENVEPAQQSPGPGASPPQPLSPAPAELKARAEAANATLSQLRAKAQEAVERLQRVMAAVEKQVGPVGGPALPPATVERLLRASATPSPLPRSLAGAAGGGGTPLAVTPGGHRGPQGGSAAHTRHLLLQLAAQQGAPS